jgi:hypothetical protein
MRRWYGALALGVAILGNRPALAEDPSSTTHMLREYETASDSVRAVLDVAFQRALREMEAANYTLTVDRHVRLFCPPVDVTFQGDQIVEFLRADVAKTPYHGALNWRATLFLAMQDRYPCNRPK